jgi:hypothetical protein
MSNLKKDITQILANLYSQAYADGAVGHSRNDDILTAHKEIINLIESVVGEMEQRETEDMGLKSWTPEDYKAFGRNELRADIKSKLIGEE